MKPTILIFTGYYFPGYKSGGILRNIVNTIDNLAEYYQFCIVTRDRDLGDLHPYTEVSTAQWNQIGKALVFYLPPNGATLAHLRELLNTTTYDVIYLTSFFDSLTVKLLFIRRFSRISSKRVIVAPFGEFAWASFRQKIIKKVIYVVLARLFGLYKGVIWRVSSKFEAADLVKAMSPPEATIMVVGDLPICANSTSKMSLGETDKPANLTNDLKIVFLSRISKEKNLDVALSILSKVNSRVVFDIYGPIENKSYWTDCQKLIAKMPSNIVVRYCGIVRPTKILDTFGAYDLFLFPTGGEAYGNVIAESLSAGTVVLTSQNTPWRNLQADGLGWDLDVRDIDEFASVIEIEATRDLNYRAVQRKCAMEAVCSRLFDPEVMDSNLRLFGLDNRIIK